MPPRLSLSLASSSKRASLRKTLLASHLAPLPSSFGSSRAQQETARLPVVSIGPSPMRDALFPQGGSPFSFSVVTLARHTQQGSAKSSAPTLPLLLCAGGIVGVGGGIVALLLGAPIWLIVGWIILIIMLSNLLSQHLSLSSHMHVEGAETSTGMHVLSGGDIHIPKSIEMGRHPVLHALSDTTAYLRALRIVFEPEKEGGQNP